MKTTFRFIISLSIILFFQTITHSQNINSITQDNVLKIPLSGTAPIIDGEENDICWQGVEWQPIDQIWMPYGGEMSREDFSGQYKVVWSEENNVLCFLVKTTDDVFVDGYKYDRDPARGDFYYNYDLLEVFVDENRSGGAHVFDDENTNAENAFAYHINVYSPADGKSTTEFVACDIAGKNWGDHIIANYANHFTQFVMKKNGNEYIWEFCLGVYNDSYKEEEPEKYRVKLTDKKEIGLSLAYCDNDDVDENPKVRDNFIGSVYVDEKSFNDHWQNSSGFRKAILTK